jgi:steroid delta-isomerase-like uncharacterized protein
VILLNREENMKKIIIIVLRNFNYLILLVAIVLIHFSCDTQESKKNNIDNVNNHSVKLVNELMVLWETGDTLKTDNIFTDTCTYSDVANNQTFVGIQGVNKYVHHVHDWASEIKMIVRNIEIKDSIGYVEWTFKARQTNPIKGIVLIATNKKVTLNGVTLIEFSNGKIKNASDYMDVLGFILQLGSKVELPGGVIISN